LVGLLDVPPDMPPEVTRAVGAIVALQDPTALAYEERGSL